MTTVRVRIKAHQFDDCAPESMGFELGKVYRLVPYRPRCGELFYRRKTGTGLWLARRFDRV